MILYKNHLENIKMSVYVLIGFDFNKNLIVEDSDAVLYKKIYVVGKPGSADVDNLEVVGDVNILDFYIENKLETSDDNIIFIDCRKEAKSYLDVMYLLDTTRLDKRSYYVHSGKTLRIADFLLTEQFNPFNGDELPASLSKEDRSAIEGMYKNLAAVVRAYLKAGFHLSEIQSIPDGWMMNLASQDLTLVTNYYGLNPAEEIKDADKVLEFVHNSQYRKIVTECLVSIVSNYLVRNGLVDSVSVSDWYDYKNWSA